MLRSSLASFVSATLLVACATDGGDNAAGGGGKADGSTPTITFRGDFTQSLRGTLLAGSPVRVTYDLDRLTACRGETNGSEVWGVTGWAQFDAAEPVSFELSRLSGG